MKRIIVSLITILFFVMSFCYSASAAANTSFSLSDAAANSGEEFDVDLSIADNAGVAAFSVTVIFNSALITPVSFTPIEGSGFTISSNIDSASGVDKEMIYEITVTGYSLSGNVTYNGSLGKLRFKVKDLTPTCTTPIEFVEDKTELCDISTNDVAYTLTGNNVTIANKKADAALVLKDVAGIRDLTAEEKTAMGIDGEASLLDAINILNK